MKHNGKKTKKVALAATLAAIITTTPTTQILARQPYTTEIAQPGAAGLVADAEKMILTENYNGAIDALTHLLNTDTPAHNSELRTKTLNLLAQAYYHNADPKAITALDNYRRRHPATPQAVEAEALMADFHLFAHRYGQAATIYRNINTTQFNTERADQITYRHALAETKNADFQTAIPLLNKLKNKPAYNRAARYYLAYIDYADSNYDNARKAFEQIEHENQTATSTNYADNNFMPDYLDASYYTTQIAFRQKDYNKAIKQGTKLLAGTPHNDMNREITRVVGESYYNIGQYDNAYRYLEQYLDNPEADNNEPSATYKAAVIDYNNGRYEKAQNRFTTLTDLTDQIGQSACCYSGQLLMMTNEPTAAAAMFDKAYRLGFDNNTSETALYNYAVAITQGGQIPFGQTATAALEKFINTYPDSKYAPQADTYLATAYFNDKNYTQALQAINRIQNPDARALQARQNILYRAAIQATTAQQYRQAADLFAQAAQMTKQNAEIAHQSQLWLADALYNLTDYKKALQAYTKYIAAAAHNDTNLALCHYNTAYCHYQLSSFNKAQQQFATALNCTPALPEPLKADALLRRADCLYYTAQYTDAMALYNQALKLSLPGNDYAALQHANMQGLTGNNTAKLNELNNLINNNPQSDYRAEAMLEKAQTQIEMNRTADAITTFTTPTQQYPESTYGRQAMLQKAIAYNTQGNKTMSRQTYREVISRWPSSEEAQTAHQDLKAEYTTDGTINDYAQFLKNIPGAPQINHSELETLTFQAAENALADNADNIEPMQQYIAKYPDSQHLAEALFYIADAQMAASHYNDALQTLDRLLTTRPDSPLSNDALLRRLTILQQTNIASPQQIIETAQQLLKKGDNTYRADAYMAIIKHSQNPETTIQYADALQTLGGPTTDEQQAAKYYKAKALNTQGKTQQATTELTQLAQNPLTLHGAMAAVELGQQQLTQGKTKQAIETLTKFTSSSTPHTYWLARGFITLADAYYKTGKTTVAKQYIESLDQNYPGTEKEIRQMINQRLNKWK